MMNFLPILYEDEVLYSVVARYKRMCGMISKTALIRDVFGGKTAFKSTLFPQHLNKLIENLPCNSKIEVHELIRNHTPINFYTAFLSNQHSKTVVDGMIKGKGTGIEALVGIAGSKVKLNDYLKVCPKCLIEDNEHLGESYWRRSHQIVGALFCLKHEVPLVNSKVGCSDNIVDFICADEDVCDLENILITNYSEEIKRLNLKYLRNVFYLLNVNEERKDLSFINNYYIDRLREKNLASKSGNLYIKDLVTAFVNYYPIEYLNLMQSAIDITNETNWLRLFVRNNNKNRSPLRHLLLSEFLGLEVADLFNCSSTVGRIPSKSNRKPIYELSERRSKWIKLIQDNQGATRAELKVIGKGLHTWIIAHDRIWYEEVTPEIRKRENKKAVIDWNQRDEECLRLAKEAVKTLLNNDGKPIRIVPASIRRAAGVKRWFLHKKLSKTWEYLLAVTEDINSYRIRKIKWAIAELMEKQGKATVYQVQLYAGFGGNNKEIKLTIEQFL
ncbi:TnsD family Tn7-like transposition protein [Paenibacillus urinalis]|uniref:TnsD family Tn7-like transposition protein n=1 Tax=Paenibacillus urinalis TaxID=521520 RepID=A0AAX3N0L3_9BACL|nr:TnsD family Tn7-like transposition protein [Paenibacillus urinalis]WDH83376.1 TnsD family Tn7-like transposition protein [Paenibacillus urinalis]